MGKNKGFRMKYAWLVWLSVGLCIIDRDCSRANVDHINTSIEVPVDVDEQDQEQDEPADLANVVDPRLIALFREHKPSNQPGASISARIAYYKLLAAYIRLNS